MYQSIQACRGIAAVLVVLFHLGGTFAQDKYFGARWLDGPFAWGDAGVDFFFVLSGFIITATHRADFGRPQRLPGYLKKRFVRIFPTYWIVFTAVCLAAMAVPALRASMPSELGVMLRAWFLVPQDPAVVGGTGAPVLFVAWSLQYELLFYLAIALAIVRRAFAVAMAAALLAIDISCMTGASCAFPLSFLSSNFVWLFVFGVATAWFVKGPLPLPRPRIAAALGIAGFVGFGLLEVALGREAFDFDRKFVYGAFSALTIAGLARAEDAGRLSVRARWPGLIGDASYALYLLHIPVISVAVKLAVATGLQGAPAVLLAFIAIFAACVAVAVGFHLAVEKPILRRFHGRSTPARALPGETRRAHPELRTRRP